MAPGYLCWKQNFHPDYLNSAKKCETDLEFPHQLRPPEWVWTVWRQVMHQVSLKWEPSGDLQYLPQIVSNEWILSVMKLPEIVNSGLTLKQIVQQLPAPYQQILGDIDYPTDDSAAAAAAIRTKTAMIFSYGTVDKGCGVHAYMIHTVR